MIADIYMLSMGEDIIALRQTQRKTEKMRECVRVCARARVCVCERVCACMCVCILNKVGQPKPAKKKSSNETCK